MLADRGLLIFSAHNLAFLPNVPEPAALLTRSRNPARIAWNLGRLPLRLRNHRRLARLERRESDYALVNDQAHDYRLLHYYIGRDGQSRQLEETGFELLGCLDGAGGAVQPGDSASGQPELHYVARVSA